MESFAMTTLYHKGKVIKSLKEHFSVYLKLLGKPTSKKVFSILIAIIATQELRSIRFLYQWFMVKLSNTSLNSYYYMLGEKLPLDDFALLTVKLAMACIPPELSQQPIFLIIDDTLQEKYGVHFECYQKMFDHAQKNGSNYLNGHCFVCLSINVPVWVNEHIHYLCIPVSYRLRQEGQNKLEIAATMIETVMPQLSSVSTVILLVDSWYPKGAVRKTVAKYDNLEMIANVRVDTKLHDLPPKRTLKRGRPKTKGDRLDIHVDFKMSKVGDYFIGAREVITSLFDHVVYATVTATDLSKPATYRVFLSTILPEKIVMELDKQENRLLNNLSFDQSWLLPYFLYSLRWNIEIIFYEHKTFWALGSYMLRSRHGIENYANLIALSYAAVELLPFQNPLFQPLTDNSAQSKKYCIAEAIHRELFFFSFVDSLQIDFNSHSLFKAFD